MTLLARMVAELVWTAGVWLGALAALGAVVALAVRAGTRRRDAGLRRATAWSIAAGAGLMALAHRLGLPEPLALSLLRRDFLVTWAVLGAAAGAVTAVVRSAGRAGSRDGG